MATKPAGRTLAAFLAAKPKPARDCAVCRLPQVAEINETRARRKPFTKCEDILAWLIADQGVKDAALTVRALQDHFTGKHHVAP